MKAIVTITLVKPTRFDRKVLKETIIARKEVIVETVNKFIDERANKENFIKVDNFYVEILDYKNRIIKQWSYKPTYR